MKSKLHLNIFFTEKTEAGFTLIETLLVIALLGVVAAFGAPVVWSFSMQNDLDIATSIFARSLRRAQSLAAYSSGDSAWGVELQTQSVTLFEGSSFSGRNPDFDEVYLLPISLSLSGPTEVVFSKFSGLPQTAGATVINNSLNQSRTVSVSAAGLVSY